VISLCLILRVQDKRPILRAVAPADFVRSHKRGRLPRLVNFALNPLDLSFDRRFRSFLFGDDLEERGLSDFAYVDCHRNKWMDQYRDECLQASVLLTEFQVRHKGGFKLVHRLSGQEDSIST
jgi:hypothetical protein